MFGDLLVDTEMLATGCGGLCHIPALPLPNFGLLLSTCLSYITYICNGTGMSDEAIQCDKFSLNTEDLRTI